MEEIKLQLEKIYKDKKTSVEQKRKCFLALKSLKETMSRVEDALK